MKDLAKAGSMKAKRWIERLLLAAGLILLLGYIAARIDAAVMCRASLWSFATSKSGPSTGQEVGIRAASAGVRFAAWPEKRLSAYAKAWAAKFASPMAVLCIRKLQMEIPVFDGTDDFTLNRGAGRIPGTARPGEQGNIGIAGHRDGFFRRLKNIRMGDEIELAVRQQKFVYVVDNIAVVGPDDTSVLKTRTRTSLTLVTCYPFYFVGYAPRRYIVQASLTSSGEKSSGLSHKVQSLAKEKTQ